RPIEVVGARRAKNGALVGGRIVAASNAEIPDFSLEQYEGNPPGAPLRWRTASWVHGGERLDFYTYLCTRLSAGELAYRPVEELRAMLESVCFDIRSRKQAIEISTARGIQNMSPPPRLPDNIYGTHGVWELYSTPSRDARLKTAFKEMYDLTAAFLQMDMEDAPRLDYDGDDLSGDLLTAWHDQNAACDISYVNSAGQVVKLTIEDVMTRLYDLSFDPYHCIERRWGAMGEELATCPDGAVKSRWYEAQRFLRNQIDRTYDVDMGYTPDDLERGPWGLRTGRGVEQGPEVNVRELLGRATSRRTASGEIANPPVTP